jgi:hypothetical protein
MCPEELNSQIKLIFARACAEAMNQHVEIIARVEPASDREAYAEAAGAFYASAYEALMNRFKKGSESSSQLRGEAVHTVLSSSTRAADPQSGEGTEGQA